MECEARARAAAVGARIGDALAMPAHWYYDTRDLAATFGRVDFYLPPPALHPGSILWRSSYGPREPEYDILGDQRRFWGQRGVHYHQNLRAGENTLNLKLMNLALSLVETSGDYDRDEYIRHYQDFMLRPADHRDTYVEECHRGFFENLKRGVPAARAAVKEKHIGGMVAVIPLYALLRAHGRSHEAASTAVRDHVSVTHAGRQVATAVDTLTRLAGEILDRRAAETDADETDADEHVLYSVLTDHLERQDLDFLRGPIARLAAMEEPMRVIGPRYSPACYLDDAMPATFYLALRYSEQPTDALIENTMAGGDNCHRGAVLGALFGLAGGINGFPDRWVSGLSDQSGRRDSR